MKKKYLFLIVLLILCCFLSACAKNTDPISKSGFHFNTVIQITIYDPDKESLLEDCFVLARQYEGYFSNTLSESDISKINAAGGKPVAVHDETIELLQKGIAYGELSDGKFDITIGQLSDLWNISTKALLEETDASMVPSQEEISKALSTVDYRNILIEGNEVTLANPEAKIDLGGIAKGYIADKMKEYLNANGVTSGFINLGGNVLTLGPKEAGNGTSSRNSTYTIGIQKPFSEDSIATVKVTDETVVSSGVYERYFTVDGTNYHHILDTSTGYPYDNGLLGITIITDESVDGDALSTMCFSLGLEEGMKFVENLQNTEAVFITEDYQIHMTSGIGREYAFTKLE